MPRSWSRRCYHSSNLQSAVHFKIEQKGMTFDHDYVYSFPLFSSPLKKEGRRKGERIAKIVIKSHAFLLDLILKSVLSGKQNMLENVFCFQANYQMEINKNVLTRVIKKYMKIVYLIFLLLFVL